MRSARIMAFGDTRTTGDAGETGRVGLDQLAEIAQRNAVRLWGGRVARGRHFPLFDVDETITAYLFPFARNAQDFPDEDRLTETVNGFRAPEERDAFASRFGSITVSASRTNVPVLRASGRLHERYLIADGLARMAREALDVESVDPGRVFYLGVHAEYHEFISGHRRILISSCDPKPYALEDLQAAFAGTPRAEQTDPEFPERVAAAWREEMGSDGEDVDPSSLETALREVRIPLWRLVPFIDYTYWCDPTSWAMVCAFWDNYVQGHGTVTGYGRLVDHWLRHPNDPKRRQYGKNVPNIIDEIIDPKTGTWPKDPATGKGKAFPDTINQPNGYRFTRHTTIGTGGNQWGWSVLKSELDAGRPVVWGIVNPHIAHAVTLIGYRIQGARRKVIAIDAANPNTPTRINEYDYDQFRNAPYQRVGIGRLSPGGGTHPDHLVILGPDGGETVEAFSPVTITWRVWGHGITRASLHVSWDEGNTWSLIAANRPCEPGQNAFVWHPGRPANRARVKVEGYTAANGYIAGDGSQGNFRIRPAPIRAVQSYSIGWNHAAHGGYVLLRFAGAPEKLLGPLGYAAYRRYVDMLRNEKPVSYDPNSRTLLTFPEPVGEEE